MQKYKRYDGESDDELIYRIGKDKELIGTWQDVCDILNELTGNDYNESAYRKKIQIFNRMLDSNQSHFADSQTELEEIRDAQRELERMKIQFRDERNAWNKQNYIDARVSQKMDYLEQCLQDFGKIQFSAKNREVSKSNNDLWIMLSDLHIGQTFDSNWGSYNSEIAKERLQQYLDNILVIADRHHSENAYVSIIGDLISGAIHHTIQVTNRENVIEQIKLAAEIITSFCAELSQHFNKVVINNVSGNHSRMTKKDEALHDERLDDLIGWIVKNSLSHLKNVEFKDDNEDIGIASLMIRGKEYVTVHGDFDPYSASGVSYLCMMLQRFPYCIGFGHLHHSSVDETNGIKMVRSGSLAGSGDAYTVEKRLSGKPSQMVCVCNEKGIEAYYPIELA